MVAKKTIKTGSTPSFSNSILTRFPAERDINADLGNWKVARLHSRCEKATAERFHQLGISYYLPLYVKRSRRLDNGKPRKSVLPLFSGYLPFSGDFSLLEVGNHCPYVCQILEVRDQQKFVQQLSQIYRLLTHNPNLKVESGIKVGKVVKVMTGPLEGLEGIVEKEGTKNRFFVHVEFFKQTISAQVEEDSLILVN